MERLRRLFLLPSVVVLGALFVLPMLIVLLYSFEPRGVYGGGGSGFTSENYQRLIDGLYPTIFVRTFVMAAIATAGCLLFGFPLALFISRAGARRRNLYLQLV